MLSSLFQVLPEIPLCPALLGPTLLNTGDPVNLTAMEHAGKGVELGSLD